MKNKPNTGRPVVVTTSHRGVFFGYLKEQNGDTVILTKAKMCLYWSDKVRGVLGLATVGPIDKSRVGPEVTEIEIFGITAVIDATKKAVAAWDLSPW